VATDFKFLKIGIAVEDLLVPGNAVILDPSARADQPVRQPPDMSLPITD
jgi:hypothetical protein